MLLVSVILTLPLKGLNPDSYQRGAVAIKALIKPCLTSGGGRGTMFLSVSGRARPIFPSSNPRPLTGVMGEPLHLRHLSLTRPLAFSLWPGNRPMAVGPWPGNRPMALWLREGSRPTAVWLREGNRLTAVWLREGSRLTAAVTTMSPEVQACWKAIGLGHRIHGVSSEYGKRGKVCMNT